MQILGCQVRIMFIVLIFYKNQKISFICSPNKKHDSVAQLVEQQTLNLWVLSSSLSGVTYAQ